MKKILEILKQADKKMHMVASYAIALTAFVLIVAQDWTLLACDPQQQQKTYFDGCTKLEHIYVPWSDDDSIVNAYKVAYGWDTHASKIVSLNEDGSIPE